jgi:small subunit ribosomal protein S16
MVVIRLTRGGAKKRPFYHVVAADKRCARDGRNLETLGYFNPVATGGETRLKLDLNKINEWVGKGAQASDRVKSLIAEFKKTAQEEKAA